LKIKEKSKLIISRKIKIILDESTEPTSENSKSLKEQN
jgi:hypothetical protein